MILKSWILRSNAFKLNKIHTKVPISGYTCMYNVHIFKIRRIHEFVCWQEKRKDQKISCIFKCDRLCKIKIILEKSKFRIIQLKNYLKIEAQLFLERRGGGCNFWMVHKMRGGVGNNLNKNLRIFNVSPPLFLAPFPYLKIFINPENFHEHLCVYQFQLI